MSFKNECKRKVLHFCGLFVIVFYMMFDLYTDHPRIYMIGILASILFFFLFADFFRIRKIFPEEHIGVINHFNRHYEVQNLSAITYFMSAALVCVMLFQKEVFFAAIAVGLLADASAALVGISIGKKAIVNGKTVEGSTTFFLVSLVCLFIFFQRWEIVIVALIVTLVELFAYKLNDNLTLPLVCAFLLVAFSLGTFYGGKTLKTLLS